ncbi:MAG: ribonuclease HII [Methanocorpusculum sp.]|nr:ribonuclease HII [Methanocorpusculum sp.]
MWICGIDEAGKGPVLGPMVAAGVLVSDDEDLSSLGIRDSKQLSAKKREVIFEEICASYKTAVVVKSPAEIDVRECTMNQFTVFLHAEVLRTLSPDRVYLDACDVNAERFGVNVLSASGIDAEVVSEHKADARYAVVGAASIVAKVTRDRIIDELRLEFGEIGSGYPSDAKTVAFLKEYIREHGVPPACARKSWQTVTDILSKSAQKNLFDF